jgi:hypothetical protein
MNPMLRRSLARALLFIAPMSVEAEIFPQPESRFPDGTVLFGLSYPPSEKSGEGFMQGFFLHAKSQARLAKFFFLPGTSADGDRPGTSAFDNYNIFDYVWSADSSPVAIIHNMRHFGAIHPFRRRGHSFAPLQMPDLVRPLERRMTDVLQQSTHTAIEANRWTRKHQLIATIARGAQVKQQSGNRGAQWKEFSRNSR